MQAKDFFDYIEKNASVISITKDRCVDPDKETVLGNANGKYYTVWSITGGGVRLSGRKGEPLENVANRWAILLEEVTVALQNPDVKAMFTD